MAIIFLYKNFPFIPYITHQNDYLTASRNSLRIDHLILLVSEFDAYLKIGKLCNLREECRIGVNESNAQAG